MVPFTHPMSPRRAILDKMEKLRGGTTLDLQRDMRRNDWSVNSVLGAEKHSVCEICIKPSVEKSNRKKNKKGQGIGIGNKDIATHSLQCGCFEESEQSCVIAFIGNKNHQRKQILVTVPSIHSFSIWFSLWDTHRHNLSTNEDNLHFICYNFFLQNFLWHLINLFMKIFKIWLI